jgi:hypothetical protein
MSYVVPMNAAPPKAITRDQACAAIPLAVEDRSPRVLDRLLALAYGAFFVFLTVAGSLWILADLSATLHR